MSRSANASVMIVGAGAAGISAALWLDDFGVPFDWVDAAGDIGGTLRRVHNEITDYPGKDHADGRALIRAFERQLQRRQLAPRPVSVHRLEVGDTELSVVEDTGVSHRVQRAILATGTQYRRLEVPGEASGLGDYISQSATADGEDVAGRPVAVVGGGDAGFENALRLAGLDCPVTMLLRNPEFRARSSFVEAVKDHPSVEIAPIPSVVRRIEAIDDGCRLCVEQRGEETTVDVARLFVRIGVDPVVPDGCDGLETDADGYLVVDAKRRSSNDKILAAGDITSTSLRCVATAVGQGAEAAQTCATELGML